MTSRQYQGPEAFKQALETRIRQAAAASRMDMGRFRQLLIFDRFLARVFAEFDDQATLKGGMVLELRLERARMTRDVDLRMSGNPDQLLERLQKAGRTELGDFLTFIVGPDSEHPTIEGEGAVYEGQRFRAEARVAGKLYGMPFGVDVAFGDVLLGEPEILVGSHFLDFIGVPPTSIRIYPRESHLAEKVHAYTLPRQRENSRVKDLADIALLAQSGPYDAARLLAALQQTFAFRQSHDLPEQLPNPPSGWPIIYARMAKENNLTWKDLDSLLVAARAFIDPVLSGKPGFWNPERWTWTEPGGTS